MRMQVWAVGLLAVAAIAGAVSVTVALGWWFPVALGYDFAVEYYLIAAALVVMSWGLLAGPAVASFLARRSWVDEVRQLRRRGRAVGPTATWSLHPHHDGPAGRLTDDARMSAGELRRDGVVVATVEQATAAGAGPRIRGGGREAAFTAGPRLGSLTLRDHREQVLGEIALHRWIWSGYHRAELGGQILLAPLARRRPNWNAVDDTGTIRTLAFPDTTDTALHAELAADLDPVALAAVLWYFTEDRRHAALDDYWRG